MIRAPQQHTVSLTEQEVSDIVHALRVSADRMNHPQRFRALAARLRAATSKYNEA